MLPRDVPLAVVPCALLLTRRQITDSLSGPDAASFAKSPQAAQTLVWNIGQALVTIISALAEAQDDILLAVAANDQVLGLLFALVRSEAVPTAVVNSTLSCMVTLSEDNRQFVERILGDSHTKCFKQLVAFKLGGGLRAVLACGVLHNVFTVMQWDDANPGREKSSDAALIPELSAAMQQAGAPDNQSDSDPTEVLELALEILASIGTNLQESLMRGNKSQHEVFKGTGVKDEGMEVDGDEDDDEGEGLSDEEGKGEDEEMDQDEMEADMDMVTGADDQSDAVSGVDDLPTLKLLMQDAIPQVIKTFQSPRENEASSSLIRTHAVTTLSNIAWTVSCLDFSDAPNETILKAWIPIAQTIWKQVVAAVLASDTSDVGLATIVTSLAWALARTLREQAPLEGGEHKRFISLYHASKSLPAENDDPFQSLGVKCVGVLGQLAMDPAPMELNREIGVFLLTVVTALPETPAADAVEALNQLFDIYGDEEHACDKQVFWRDGFLKHFEEVTPKLKAAAKQVDKRTQTELRTRADEAILNLSRFIQYKQKHKP